ncbi:MAG: hypothetical protein COS22_00120 [Candidatus Huberarchaeum crystalense]|uniref:Uncharacterized protein n=3 Tax=Huberarchaeum crystalense TaxID=2014257 RepID=A0A2H9M814_HUBC1|nr:hypothetical protein [archaeon]OIP20645.1 MAG: hypothetical protein AUJ91_00700 [archaeon CG2_30_31_98]PIV46671.1 MAG: hypothetical protein COS22_00120 [Candidatus Huberarchaeum crystalense]
MENIYSSILDTNDSTKIVKYLNTLFSKVEKNIQEKIQTEEERMSELCRLNMLYGGLLVYLEDIGKIVTPLKKRLSPYKTAAATIAIGGAMLIGGVGGDDNMFDVSQNKIKIVSTVGDSNNYTVGDSNNYTASDSNKLTANLNDVKYCGKYPKVQIVGSEGNISFKPNIYCAVLLLEHLSGEIDLTKKKINTADPGSQDYMLFLKKYVYIKGGPSISGVLNIMDKIGNDESVTIYPNELSDGGDDNGDDDNPFKVEDGDLYMYFDNEGNEDINYWVGPPIKCTTQNSPTL